MRLGSRPFFQRPRNLGTNLIPPKLILQCPFFTPCWRLIGCQISYFAFDLQGFQAISKRWYWSHLTKLNLSNKKKILVVGTSRVKRFRDTHLHLWAFPKLGIPECIHWQLHFKALSSKEIQLTLPILSAPAFFPNQCEPFATFLGQKTHIPRPFWLKKISVKSLSSREVFQMFHQLQRCILILPSWAKVEKVAKVWYLTRKWSSKNSPPFIKKQVSAKPKMLARTIPLLFGNWSRC